MPRGQLSTERDNVDPNNYKTYNELPLVHTGCDSYASWDPRFKKFSQDLTVEQIVDKMQELLPNKDFEQIHLILTGGEPLLGWQRDYIKLLREIERRELGLFNITFETNGTRPLISQLKDALENYSVTFSVSAKLPSSGHSLSEAIRPEVIQTYSTGNSTTYFKFVISNHSDLDDVDAAMKIYRDAKLTHIPVYLMPAGGTTDGYYKNMVWVANEALKRGLRYSPRLQVNLWKNAWAT